MLPTRNLFWRFHRFGWHAAAAAAYPGSLLATTARVDGSRHPPLVCKLATTTTAHGTTHCKPCHTLILGILGTVSKVGGSGGMLALSSQNSLGYTRFTMGSDRCLQQIRS